MVRSTIDLLGEKQFGIIKTIAIKKKEIAQAAQDDQK